MKNLVLMKSYLTDVIKKLKKNNFLAKASFFKISEEGKKFLMDYQGEKE